MTLSAIRFSQRTQNQKIHKLRCKHGADSPEDSVVVVGLLLLAVENGVVVRLLHVLPCQHQKAAGSAGRVYQDAMFDTKEKAFSGVKIPKKA